MYPRLVLKRNINFSLIEQRKEPWEHEKVRDDDMKFIYEGSSYQHSVEQIKENGRNVSEAQIEELKSNLAKKQEEKI